MSWSCSIPRPACKSVSILPWDSSMAWPAYYNPFHAIHGAVLKKKSCICTSLTLKQLTKGRKHPKPHSSLEYSEKGFSCRFKSHADLRAHPCSTVLAPHVQRLILNPQHLQWVVLSTILRVVIRINEPLTMGRRLFLIVLNLEMAMPSSE